MEKNNFFIPENTDLNSVLITVKEELRVTIPTSIVIANKGFQTSLHKSISEHDVFQTLLRLAEPIDFSLEANGDSINILRDSLLSTSDLRGKEIIERKIEKLFPKSLQQNVIIIKKLLELAEKCGLSVGASNDKVFVFNGEFWELIALKNFEAFLGLFSEKVGLDPLEAQQFKIKDLLFRQFMSSGFLPNFNDKGDVPRIPFFNGTLIFEDGNVKLVDFDKTHFLTYKLSFSYSENADAPLFKKFLNRVLPDIDVQNIMFEFFGSIFLKKIKHEKILLLYGSGKNGKSVLHDVLHALLGSSNITSLSLASLTEHKSQSRMHLENKLLNFSSEIGLTKNCDLDMIKKLASMEPIEVKELYSNPYTITNYARLAFNCNVLPKAGENSDGFHRRFIIIHFAQTISDEEMDLDLANKIISQELPGIFNMVIDGMKRFFAQGKFTLSQSIVDESEKYRRDINSVLTFINDEQYIPSSKKNFPISAFYQSYRDFCSENGFQSFNRNKFISQLRDAKFQVTRSTNGYYHIYYDKLIDSIDDSAIVLSINKPLNL